MKAMGNPIYLHAAHIFPLAYEDIWISGNYQRWITETSSSSSASKINSVQNGLLLESGVHSLFDSYGFSINPDVRFPASFLFDSMLI